MFKNQTIASAVFTADRRSSKLPAFVFADGTAMSYGEASDIVTQLAKSISAAVNRPDARIAFAAPRGVLGVLGFLAASEIGTCCPINPRMKAEELSSLLENMCVDLLVDGSGAEEIAKVASETNVDFLRVTMNGATLHVPELSRNVLLSNLLVDDETAPAMLMATSGTTSKPKHVLLSHSNVLAAAGAIGSAFSLGPGDICLNPMPLHHVHGLISASVASLLAGSAVHCTDGFNPNDFDCAARALQPTWFTASPAMHIALREHYELTGKTPSLERLRFFRSSSAPLPPSAITALESLFLAPLIETYGLTETASMVCSNPLPPETRKQGSVGFAYGAEIRVVDKAGHTCAPGETGEIAIRGPSVITQYADNAAPDSFVDGWLLTGDLGRMDDDNYLFIVGRMKEVIKRGGLSVYPAEIDDALCCFDYIAEAVTFAVPHTSLGEDVVSAVVARAGVAIDVNKVRASLAERLSTYKVPSAVLAVTSIPKNETGKIVRRHVASVLAPMIEPCGEPAATSSERALLEVWQQVLGRADIGVTDNVFLHGADPLRASVAADLIGASRLWAPSVKDLLAAPTVREQAREVQS